MMTKGLHYTNKRYYFTALLVTIIVFLLTVLFLSPIIIHALHLGYRHTWQYIQLQVQCASIELKYMHAG